MGAHELCAERGDDSGELLLHGVLGRPAHFIGGLAKVAVGDEQNRLGLFHRARVGANQRGNDRQNWYGEYEGADARPTILHGSEQRGIEITGFRMDKVGIAAGAVAGTIVADSTMAQRPPSPELLSARFQAPAISS